MLRLGPAGMLHVATSPAVVRWMAAGVKPCNGLLRKAERFPIR